MAEIDDGSLTVVPANEVDWEDLQAVLGAVKCHGDRCYCQRFKVPAGEWRSVSDAERAFRLRVQTGCGDPDAETTSGLVARLDGEPVGWCALEPRPMFTRLTRIVWAGRAQDRTDADVWALTCFIVRPGFRGRGITYALAAAAVDHARKSGARALEGYPMVPEPGKPVQWGEMYVGNATVFEAAGFSQVAKPSLRRVVMRVEF
jgi:GNAT superfamily N-acetyltransferase